MMGLHAHEISVNPSLIQANCGVLWEYFVRFSRRLEIAILLLVSPMMISGQTSAQKGTSLLVPTSVKASSTQKPDDVAARLSAIVASGHLNDLRWPDFSDYRSHLTNFYHSSGYKPAWILCPRAAGQRVRSTF
jgi:hypothetical protein